jgi:hypothetical protein
MTNRKATLSLVVLFLLGYVCFAAGAYARLGNLVPSGQPTVQKEAAETTPIPQPTFILPAKKI